MLLRLGNRETIMIEELIKKINDMCTDWDGSRIADNAEPRYFLNCGDLRDILWVLETYGINVDE